MNLPIPASLGKCVTSHIQYNNIIIFFFLFSFFSCKKKDRFDVQALKAAAWTKQAEARKAVKSIHQAAPDL